MAWFPSIIDLTVKIYKVIYICTCIKLWQKILMYLFILYISLSFGRCNFVYHIHIHIYIERSSTNDEKEEEDVLLIGEQK